eukprot:gnl/MRDRNA2_/MRDRNA2_101797_c0_seq1.p1 gnl/MRDRNA2_/MRDRNA2_101797_c0~~gnl/MRDRNA2_/MRDRNA2_101797_c0_seq1.p1  ORF type:complete len:378 (+),score=69.19 gnl/MRDRNA2_/MRDRNA2_101797_c0_seq1:57-1190(+)
MFELFGHSDAALDAHDDHISEANTHVPFGPLPRHSDGAGGNDMLLAMKQMRRRLFEHAQALAAKEDSSSTRNNSGQMPLAAPVPATLSSFQDLGRPTGTLTVQQKADRATSFYLDCGTGQGVSESDWQNPGFGGGSGKNDKERLCDYLRGNVDSKVLLQKFPNHKKCQRIVYLHGSNDGSWHKCCVKQAPQPYMESGKKPKPCKPGKKRKGKKIKGCKKTKDNPCREPPEECIPRGVYLELRGAKIGCIGMSAQDLQWDKKKKKYWEKTKDPELRPDQCGKNTCDAPDATCLRTATGQTECVRANYKGAMLAIVNGNDEAGKNMMINKLPQPASLESKYVVALLQMPLLCSFLGSPPEPTMMRSGTQGCLSEICDFL